MPLGLVSGMAFPGVASCRKNCYSSFNGDAEIAWPKKRRKSAEKISKDYHTLIFFLLLLYGCFVKSNVYQKLNLSSFISKMILLLCSTILFHNYSFSKVKFFPQCYGKGRNGEMKSFYS